VVEVRGLSSRKGHCKGMLFLGEKGDGIVNTVPKKSRILEGSSSESLLEKRKNHTYTHIHKKQKNPKHTLNNSRTGKILKCFLDF
jgi:hypothetical protein